MNDKTKLKISPQIIAICAGAAILICGIIRYKKDKNNKNLIRVKYLYTKEFL